MAEQVCRSWEKSLNMPWRLNLNLCLLWLCIPLDGPDKNHDEARIEGNLGLRVSQLRYCGDGARVSCADSL